MTQNTSIAIITGLFLAINSEQSLALGSDDEWLNGVGQGTSASFVTSGEGNEIYVGCGWGTGRNLMTFELEGKRSDGSRVFLSFDGGPTESLSLWDGGIITNDCNACEATFDYIIERIKQHSDVQVMFENGDSATFTLNGAAQAIGECTADF